MRKLYNTINDLLLQTNYILGLDGIRVSSEMDIDENDVNVALELIKNGSLGKGNHYNNELSMALYFEEVEKKTSSKQISDMLLSYSYFLLIDGITKYILYRVRKNGDLDKSISLVYGKRIRALNESVRKYGPMNVLEKCMDRYMEICYTILMIVGQQTYVC